LTWRIPLEASGFETRDRFQAVFAEWRPLLCRNPILILKPPANAIMQTLLFFFAMSEPSPLALMITGAISLGLLAIFLRHRLG